MKLKITCPFCKPLDIAELLEDESCLSEGLHKKMIRYYCNSPDVAIDYCPYCGIQEGCPYNRD